MGLNTNIRLSEWRNNEVVYQYTFECVEEKHSNIPIYVWMSGRKACCYTNISLNEWRKNIVVYQ